MAEEPKSAPAAGPAHVDDLPKLRELALPGEGGDRAFRAPSGRWYRVKAIVSHGVVAKPPLTAGAAFAAPTSITVRISVAELDEDKKVKEAGGQLLIFDALEILFDPEALARPDLDIEAEIDSAVRRAVVKAEATTENRSALLEHLSGAWGANLEGLLTQPGKEPPLAGQAGQILADTGSLETQALPEIFPTAEEASIDELAGRKGEGLR